MMSVTENTLWWGQILLLFPMDKVNVAGRIIRCWTIGNSLLKFVLGQLKTRIFYPSNVQLQHQNDVAIIVKLFYGVMNLRLRQFYVQNEKNIDIHGTSVLWCTGRVQQKSDEPRHNTSKTVKLKMCMWQHPMITVMI